MPYATAPPPPRSLYFFIDGEEYDFQVPELMTAERRAQLAAYGSLQAVRCVGAGVGWELHAGVQVAEGRDTS